MAGIRIFLLHHHRLAFQLHRFDFIPFPVIFQLQVFARNRSSSPARPAGHVDGKRNAMAGFAAAHG